MSLFIPRSYKSKLDLIETQIAIKKLKDHFERALAYELYLTRVSAPIILKTKTGLNDNLNGTERPVVFDTEDNLGDTVEIVQSLAKWKRIALWRYNFGVDRGIYADMNAIRRDENTDNTHSIYVDQWDWEKVITKQMRTEDFLKQTVKKIYRAFLRTQKFICEEYKNLETWLPEEIFFISSQELLGLYPNLSSAERENKICEIKKAVFIMKIGDVLSNGEKHDGRAPDYDDWSLNGDILFWNPLLEKAFEISSMGIRVDENSLKYQTEKSGCHERLDLPFHKKILNKQLPYTIGGGIGQSRMCMYFLNKAHIGEVQASVWSEKTYLECEQNNIILL